MWCRHCRQDVPGIALNKGQGLGCARCGKLISGTRSPRSESPRSIDVDDSGLDLEQLSAVPATGPAAPAGSSRKAAGASRQTPGGQASQAPFRADAFRAESGHAGPPPPSDAMPVGRSQAGGPSQFEFDDWDFDPLSSVRVVTTDFVGAAPSEALKYASSAAASETSWNVAHGAHATRPPISGLRKRRRRQRSNALAWTCIAIGLAGVVVGGGCWLAASTIPSAGALAPWAWPVAAAGQAILLLGVAWQLERISQSNRVAREELASMNAQLQNLRRAGAQSSSAGPAPFGPAGHEPSAQSLLADVKSRLDLLALRMSQQRR